MEAKHGPSSPVKNADSTPSTCVASDDSWASLGKIASPTRTSWPRQKYISSMFATLTQRRLRWLGHVCRMDDGRIPKDVLYGELATGSRPTGRPALRYKDVGKRVLRASGVDPADLETASSDRINWRSTMKAGIAEAELGRETSSEERWFRRQQRIHSAPSSTQASMFTCSTCSRSCLLKIKLYSHSRFCSSTTD